MEGEEVNGLREECRGWILLLGIRDKVLKETQDLGGSLPHGLDVLNGESIGPPLGLSTQS